MIAITPQEFNQLAAYIQANYGIHLKEEKQALIMGRLHHVLAGQNIASFKEYYNYIVSDRTGKAAMTLVDKITTNHTYFMRETEHFHYLKEKVLPFLAATVKNKDLRIWSAGCSSGEEPYTLAMILNEFFGPLKSQWDTRILATDISGQVLEKAKRGVYSAEEIATLPAAWKMKYFHSYDREHVVLDPKLRNEVIFRRFNLMDAEYPFKRNFHVIFCRNVMIYFDQATKQALADKFYERLERGGYLFIGHSESLQRETTKFTYVMPAVYRKA